MNDLNDNNDKKPGAWSRNVALSMGMGLIWGIVFQNFAIGFLFFLGFLFIGGAPRRK